MAAAVLHMPDMKLEPAEAKELGDAIQEVNEHYPIPVLTEKQAAWLNLLSVSTAIYFPRIIATKLRAKKKASEEKPPVVVEGSYANVATPGPTPPRPN